MADVRVERRAIEIGPLCDFCGAQFKQIGTTIDLEYRGAAGEGQSFDCCVSCWWAKVRPALVAVAMTNDQLVALGGGEQHD